MTSAEQQAINTAFNEAYVQLHYPSEIFLSGTFQHRFINRYLRGLIIPKGVMIAVSRIPRSHDQREILTDMKRSAGSEMY